MCTNRGKKAAQPRVKEPPEMKNAIERSLNRIALIRFINESDFSHLITANPHDIKQPRLFSFFKRILVLEIDGMTVRVWADPRAAFAVKH